ncbi:MAG: hypothetical protein II975_06815 [Bacteroidales bacterium]|nr:hypothetical protein [Bacteroidales bacterium]
MKQFITIVALVSAIVFSGFAEAQNASTRTNDGTFFLGGTGSMGYSGTFNFSLEPVIGYEFTDRWSIGTGIGMALASSGGYTAVIGIAEPFVRFCVWHNDLVYIDIKATGGVGFDNTVQLCQIGIRPSLRFRLSEHCDMAADIGLFGAQYTPSTYWQPSIGVSATSVGLWFAYRF